MDAQLITNRNTDEGCRLIPSTDIYENDSEYIIKSEMPGVAKEGLEVTLKNNELEINGRINGNFPDSSDLKYSEFDLYDYYRKLTIDNTVDSNALSANLENGILTIKLPKKEEAKPRRIEVKIQ
ncbi:MAG: Hsp20/alpha crystallin family protein [Spirochaetota bacterium]